MNLIQAIILGIVEGITEFLPISSTGHMKLAEYLLKVNDKAFANNFEIIIQFAAILAVLTLYYKRFFVGISIYLKLGVAFIPAAIIGFILEHFGVIDAMLNPFVVCISLVLGGLVLIVFDKWTEKKSEIVNIEDISYQSAFTIGLIQCISMIPGVSRSAATIFGGILKGFDRKQAAEFSFLLAIPTMMGATCLKLVKHYKEFHQEQYLMLAVGGAVAFIFAFIAVKAFIAYLTKHGFKYFGLYRIIVGAVFLLLALAFQWQIDK